MFDLGSLLAQSSPPRAMEMIDKLARTPLSQILIFAAILTAVRLVCHPYLMKTTEKADRRGGYMFVKFVNELADALVYAAIVVFMLVRPFGVQTFYIPSGSMIDTLHLNDYIAANKFIYRVSEPKDGDIVVFKPPQLAKTPGTPDSDFIKRLIGIPGDVIEIRDRKLYRNGQVVEEPYVRYTRGDRVLSDEEAAAVTVLDFKMVNDNGRIIPVQYQNDLVNLSLNGTPLEYQPKTEEERQRWLKAEPAPIPQGYYLFMGDNRNGSFDSRYWGLVPRDSIIGRSEFIWVPFSRWRVTR